MTNTNFKLGMRAIHQKDIKTAITEAVQNGFEVLEIHLSSPQFLPENYTTLQLQAVKTFAKNSGIMLQTHSEIGQSLIQADKILRKAEQQKLEQMVKFSRNIGARCLTIHPGKAPVYHDGPGKAIRNDHVYAKHYIKLFEDSLKHITSIASKDLFICIENTDNFNLGYQKILSKYLKTNKVFLTWDLLKNFSWKPQPKLLKDRWQFLNKNIDSVRNLHISGPSHASIKGHEKTFLPFFILFQGQNLPMIIETPSLKNVIEAKKIMVRILKIINPSQQFQVLHASKRTRTKRTRHSTPNANHSKLRVWEFAF